MRRILFTILSLLVLVTACEPEYGGSVGVQPDFLPVEFSFNTRGEIAITPNQRIVTPLGTITLAAAATIPVTGPPSETLLVINHYIDGGAMQSRYRLDADTTEELCQRVWIDLARRMRSFRYDPGMTFRGWLRRLCQSRAIDLLRKKKADAAQTLKSHVAASFSQDAADRFDAEEGPASERPLRSRDDADRRRAPAPSSRRGRRAGLHVAARAR